MREINAEVLAEVTSRIVAAVHPEKIVLFGSHVWGRPTADSDIDLMVIVGHSEQPGYRLAREIYHSLRGLRVPVEVVVRTRKELERNSQVKASLERRVLDEGKVLHG